jgi:hypothetical protein
MGWVKDFQTTETAGWGAMARLGRNFPLVYCGRGQSPSRFCFNRSRKPRMVPDLAGKYLLIAGRFIPQGGSCEDSKI